MMISMLISKQGWGGEGFPAWVLHVFISFKTCYPSTIVPYQLYESTALSEPLLNHNFNVYLKEGLGGTTSTRSSPSTCPTPLPTRIMASATSTTLIPVSTKCLSHRFKRMMWPKTPYFAHEKTMVERQRQEQAMNRGRKATCEWICSECTPTRNAVIPRLLIIIVFDVVCPARKSLSVSVNLVTSSTINSPDYCKCHIGIQGLVYAQTNRWAWQNIYAKM
jgi:hypothetical protein